MSKIQPDENMKNKLNELREQLSNLLITNNLQSEKVLETSREIDILILNFYSCNLEQ